MSAVEQSLQSLKVAMLADSFRTQHEQTTARNQFEETIMHLRSSVSMHQKIATLWEKKYGDCRKACIRMVEGAKNNQRYLTGLQNDFEKLQKTVDDSKVQNTEAWLGKIHEIEDEKKVLRHEFEITAKKLTNSLRNMKKVLDDLYLELVISESKRKDLLEMLSKQEASCKAAEKGRKDLEKQLFSCAQGGQSQLGSSFNAILSKIESLQSAQKTNADSRQKSGIQECLDVLRGLKATDFLKVEKLEGMLRPINER